jgi:hypothetical protein
MDLDEEILQRLTNTEDHLTERKSKPHRDQCTEAMVAFANSALPNKAGILYVGVDDKGEVLHDKAPESWQHHITAWGNGCFPELPVIPRTLIKDGKEFLAVVVPRSEVRPHFARPAFKRQGAKTIPASHQEIDEWIAYRNSKVRFILDWKDKTVHVQQRKEGIGGSLFDESGEYTLLNCNPWFVTAQKHGGLQKTFPLSAIDLKMNDATWNELMLIYRP